MESRELLIDTVPHIPPARALEGLSAEDAERRPSGASHSVVEIVAHMTFWMEWFCHRCEGQGHPMAAHAADGWPGVLAGAWPDVERAFLEGLDRAASFGVPQVRLDQRVMPAIEFPPLAHYTIRDALVHIATHNAHHLGQVILLRQLLRQWPPPAGSWTW